MLLAPFRLIARVARRFHTERYTQTAASLSFSTLLGLVPLLAVGIALISSLPFTEALSQALAKFLLANLLPEKAGVIIAKYLTLFAHKATRLTLAGAAILAVTAFMQMLTIEYAFNAIWRVKNTRPWLRRFAMHLFVLLLGPLLFGGSLALTGYLAGISFGVLNEPRWVNQLTFRILSLAFMALLFALLYRIVPNRTVSNWHAAIGGILAMAGFSLIHRLFSVYVANFPAYTVLYGAFAAIPIFLVWLYLSWGVVLLGALIVAELPNVFRSAGKSRPLQRAKRDSRMATASQRR